MNLQIPRDEFERGDWELPTTFQSQKERITRTMRTFNEAIQTVLAELCAGVGVSIPELSDDFSVSSDTALKLVFKPPIHDAGKVINAAHTDFGLATLLWYDEETTQVPVYDEQGRQTEVWQTVPVVEGSVLINIADELAAKSRGGLHSTVHRVVAPPGAKRVRNGILYLLRPYT
jgi:isopenicillin N synthase-like dioxygenase